MSPDGSLTFPSSSNVLANTAPGALIPSRSVLLTPTTVTLRTVSSLATAGYKGTYIGDALACGDAATCVLFQRAAAGASVTGLPWVVSTETVPLTLWSGAGAASVTSSWFDDATGDVWAVSTPPSVAVRRGATNSWQSVAAPATFPAGASTNGVCGSPSRGIVFVAGAKAALLSKAGSAAWQVDSAFQALLSAAGAALTSCWAENSGFLVVRLHLHLVVL